MVTAEQLRAPTPFPMGAPRGFGAVSFPTQEAGLPPGAQRPAPSRWQWDSGATPWAGDAVGLYLTHLSVRRALLVSPMEVP